MKYICVAPNKEQFNVYGESLGMSGKRALYYSIDIGTHRIYRNQYPLKPFYFNGININKSLKLLKYEKFEDALNMCNEINNIFIDNFEPRIYDKKTIKKFKNYFKK